MSGFSDILKIIKTLFSNEFDKDYEKKGRVRTTSRLRHKQLE